MMNDNRPWKVMVDGYCYHRYKRKSAAIKRANVLKGATPSDCKICVSSGFEVIEIWVII